MTARKRGAPTGNQNALTHGRFSRAYREQRRAAAEERAGKSRAWMAQLPRWDWQQTCDEIEQWKRKDS